MAEYADLEIGLHRREADSYAIEFRFSQPNSEADVRLGQGQLAQATIDLSALISLASDPGAYGKSLTQSFFAEPTVQTAFAQARASAQSLGSSLRLRLAIGPSASELHSLHWETLPPTISPKARFLNRQDAKIAKIHKGQSARRGTDAIAP